MILSSRGVRRLISVFGAVGLTLMTVAFGAEDPFAANVRPTDPHTPTEQQKAFDLPDDFHIELVACEPDINKPMNMAFDATGRLWVTTSREYPRPAPPGRVGRDRIMIFDDFAPDGRARKVTEFASGLNIPIGVYPYRTPNPDGQVTWKAIVWSIPNIWYFEDTDGDGRADRQEPLYGPFDYSRDTHGNQSSFHRGFDGWMYATHGYNNDSHVTGRDGHTVHMNSGNTYRIRLDGSRIEHYTWGQVNPFGLAWDPDGNLFSSDCHSEPIYLLLPGGYYPSFGKPDDGLGFAPNMMEKVRGSTAIDGISYYANDLWPDPYMDSIFIGDVMTSRVYRDSAIERGSGKIARPRPDFVISRDPWFRPVNTIFGPDGALYIADFYNRIIGHYEVPLDHPGRDRERGRIWRMVYDGKPLRPRALPQDEDGLLNELASPSLDRRLLAMNDLIDRFGASLEPALRRLVAAPRNTFQCVHALWLLNRLDALEDSTLLAAAHDTAALIRLHAMRIAAERARAVSTPAGEKLHHGFSREMDAAAVNAVDDRDPRVQRCAAETLGLRPRFEHLRPLLDLLHRVKSEDSHLVYTVRQALRNTLEDDAVFGKVLAPAVPWSEPDLRAFLDVAVAVRSSSAARFLLQERDLYAGQTAAIAKVFAHVARYGGPEDLESLARIASSQTTGGLDFEADLFHAIEQGFAQRGTPLSASVKGWGAKLGARLLDSVRPAGAWVNIPFDGAPTGANPWAFEERPCADGRAEMLLSSHPRGEQLTGRLQSPPFQAPSRLTFYLAGHDGPPARPHPGHDRVTLKDATTGQVIAEAAPPGKDTAQQIVWDLGGHAGQSVILEVSDEDSGSAFAWLAFGRIEPPVLTVPTVAPADAVERQVAAADIASACNVADQLPGLRDTIQDRHADPVARAAAARAILTDPIDRAVAELVGDATQPAAWRGRLANAIFDEDRSGREPFLESVWRDAPRRFQVAIGSIAAVRPNFARELVKRMSEGTAPASLLRDRRLRDRLTRIADPDVQAQIEKLAAALPDEDVELQRLVEERRQVYLSGQPDAAHGREVFTTACSACHRVGDQGGLVGPQLTGIGTRGLERLCEDILAPNRNVDRAFWTTSLELKDGDAVTGLFRREEGNLLVLANSAGAEFTVPKETVRDRRETSISLMPSNFSEALSGADFSDLMAFLLEQKGGIAGGAP